MVDGTTDTASGGTVAHNTPRISTQQYAEIASFDDALALVGEVLGGEVIDSADMGDGFALCEDKATLIGVPFIVLQANFTEGEYRREDGSLGTFVSCRVVTEDGRKLVVNDGSTGIHEQIKMLWQMKPETAGKAIICRNGLRVSEYDHPVHGKAKTFYLDTSGKK